MRSMKEIGADIKAFRKEAGLTQKQLAEKLGVTNSAISNWELGETKIDIEILIELAKLMDISVDDLVKDKPTLKDSYKMYEYVTFEKFKLKVIDVNAESYSGSSVKLLITSTSDKLVDMTPFKYSLVCGEKQLRETTKVFDDSYVDEDGYDYGDRIMTTEKLSTQLDILPPKSSIEVTLIFESRMNLQESSYIHFSFDKEYKKLHLDSSIVRSKNNRYNRFNEDEIEEILKYYTFQKDEDKIIQILDTNFDVIDLNLINHFELVNYLDIIRRKFKSRLASDVNDYQIKHDFKLEYLFDVKDDFERVNDLIKENKNLLLNVDENNVKSLGRIYKLFYSDLTDDNKDILMKAFSNYELPGKGITFFDDAMSTFIKNNSFEDTGETFLKYGTTVSYRLLKHLLENNNKFVEECLTTKDIEISSKEAISILNFYFDKLSNISKKELSEFVPDSKEEFIKVKDFVKNKDLMKYFMDEGIIELDYLM